MHLLHEVRRDVVVAVELELAQRARVAAERTEQRRGAALADATRRQVEGSDGAVGAENGCERLGSVVADGGAREGERCDRAVAPAERERELGGDERAELLAVAAEVEVLRRDGAERVDNEEEVVARDRAAPAVAASTRRRARCSAAG